MRQIQPPNNCVNKARIREVAETLVRSVFVHLRGVLAVVNLDSGQGYFKKIAFFSKKDSDLEKPRLGFGFPCREKPSERDCVAIMPWDCKTPAADVDGHKLGVLKEALPHL